MFTEKDFDAVVRTTGETLISAPILKQLTTLKKEALHFLFSQIYYLVDAFPGLLGALLLHTNDEGIRFAIVDNLLDECGGAEKLHQRDYSKAHSRLLKSFVESLSSNDGKALAPQSSHSKLMLSHFRRLFVNSHLIEVLGALAAMEGASTVWFTNLYQQLKAREEFTEEQLYFFELHTRLDEEHGNILKETLMPLLTTVEHFTLFESGAKTAAQISRDFYLSLARELEVL